MKANKVVIFNNQLSDLLDKVTDSFISFDNQWNFTYINHSAEKILSKNKEELIGKCLLNIFPNLNNSNIYTQLKKSYDEQIIINIEEFVSSTDKSFNIDCYPSEQGLSLHIKDITEKKSLEQSLKLEIQKQNNKLEIEKNKFISLLRNAPATISMLSGPEHIFEFVNDNYIKFHGNRDVIGKTARQALPEIEGQGLFELLDQVYSSGETFFGNEVEALVEKKGDGSLERFYFNFIYQPIFNNEHQVHGIVIFSYDITEQVTARKKLEVLTKELIKSESEYKSLAESLEIQIYKRTEQIKSSNESLKNFAHVASHDLQEPLRMISSYTSLLSSRYKDKLDQNANDFIAFITDGAKRMQTMIIDILSHAEIIEKNKKESLIDLNDTIEKIKRNLKLLFEDDHVILNYQHLPIIKTDSTYMVQLFQNLISNAIKYRKKDVNPIINISVKSEGNFWLFSINDNGIGINTDYFDKIFIIFQRLHGRSEYEGTGIGLANCKKIIDLYDGKIWVESIEGQGSTFYFTLPTK